MSTATSVGRSTVSRLSIGSRPTIDRLSIDWRLRGGRLSTNSRPIVDRQSDKPLAAYRSIFRPNIGHVGGISVNCRWHISQLSVAYQSCVNLAGESSGFPFERLSNVIMLLGKMLQSEAR